MKLLRKITDKKILYLFTSCILVFLPILKQASFYLVSYGVIKHYDSINPAYVLYFSIPFLIYVYVKNLIKTKRKLDIYDYLFYTLVIVGIIVTLFSIDKNISLFGKSYRHEGFFTLLCYYLLFITWKVEANKKDIKNIIRIIIFMAIFNSIYAIGQLYTPVKYILRFADGQMASGISGNPNFFGSYMVTVLGIVVAKFFTDKKISVTTILLIILFFISLINAQSTGPFITSLITILFLVVYLLIKKYKIIKKIILLAIILLITYPATIYFNKQIFNINRCEMCNFADVVSNKDANIYDKATTLGSGRMEIWGKSLELAIKNPIVGVGYDNLYLAYYEGKNLSEVIFTSVDGQIVAKRKYNEYVDNAHNVYLHTWVTSGLIGLIPYLILCLYTFIRGLKTKENLVILLLGGFVAYSVQAFANINVLQVAPIYYVIIGLILSIKE